MILSLLWFLNSSCDKVQVSTYAQYSVRYDLQATMLRRSNFEFVHGAEEGPPVITPANLPAIVGVLQESIGDEPHVAEKVK